MENYDILDLKETFIKEWTAPFKHGLLFKAQLYELFDSKVKENQPIKEPIILSNLNNKPNKTLIDILKNNGLESIVNYLPNIQTQLYYDNLNKANIFILKKNYYKNKEYIWENQKKIYNPLTNKYEGLGNLVYQYCDDNFFAEKIITQNISFSEYLNHCKDGVEIINNDEENIQRIYKVFKPIFVD